MVVIECSVPDCTFTTDDVSEALAIALLSNHNLAHCNLAPTVADAAPAPTAPRGPKLERPKVDVGVTIEEWKVFTRRWEVFESGSGIDDASVPSHLFQCAGTELEDSLLKANPNAASETLTQLLAAMHSLAVIPVATCMLRTELLQLRQERDEPFRTFTAKVRGKAETCSYTASCTCGASVDYTDHVIRDVILNGLYDTDIRREVLVIAGILETPINEVIALVETKEMARNALPSPSLSAVSSFAKQRKSPPNPVLTLSQADRAKEATCPGCHIAFKVFTEGARGWNEKPHQMCIECHRANRRKKRHQRQPPQRPPQTPGIHATETEPISQIAAFQTKGDQLPRTPRRRRHNRKTTTHVTITTPSAARLDHHIFSKGEWKRTRLRDHPRLPITISLSRPGRTGSGAYNTPSDIYAEVSAIADTGAQSDLWSLSDFIACGFSRDDLHPISLSLSAANRSPISIEGAFFAKLATQSSSGEITACHSMVYVSSSVKDMYLSYDSLLNLGLLPRTFPCLGNPTGPPPDRETSATQPHASRVSPDINAIRALNDGCPGAQGCPVTNAAHNATCSCPQRGAAPPRPSELPFPCKPENNTKMKAWLLNRYASSTFNTCPHRALPCIEGPPIEIHVDPAATPKACHTPTNIPLHWQQWVYDDLLRDGALGVMERVPYGEPVT